MVGIGLALSIVMDAAVVRTLLVPAFMVVAGRWNWWSPANRSRSPAAHRSSTIPVATGGTDHEHR
jgi:RND superfamily putative drug exporter